MIHSPAFNDMCKAHTYVYPSVIKYHLLILNSTKMLNGRLAFQHFKDQMTTQEMVLPGAKTFSRARFIVKDVYKTTKWDDTCIAETCPGYGRWVEFWNAGKKLAVDVRVFADKLAKVPDE
jgi:hypothetical protein